MNKEVNIRAILKAIEDAYGIESGELDGFVNDPELSQEALALADFVKDSSRTQEFPYCVSVLDSENNPSDNLDNFALLEDAIDHAKNNPGTAVFLEKYNSEKNICEYDLVWYPTAEGSHQEAGICPVCGSTDLDYDSLNIDTLQVCYPWTCNTCKSSGEEWYDLHFIEHTNIEKDEDEDSPRTCSHCGKGMHAGYCIEGGESYYCSDECLYANMTEEEYLDLYDDGNGDSYYTEWEDE